MENNNTTNTANAKLGSAEGAKPNIEEHSNLNADEQIEHVEQGEPQGAGSPRHPSRTPFTNLSQVDADLALARTLQEQVDSNSKLLLFFTVFKFLNFMPVYAPFWFGWRIKNRESKGKHCKS